MKALVGMNALV